MWTLNTIAACKYMVLFLGIVNSKGVKTDAGLISVLMANVRVNKAYVN